MEKPEKYRQVNQILGKNPKLGPVTIAQALVFALIILIAYLAKQGLNLSWIQTLLLSAWAMGSYLVLLGERHWRYTNKFIKTPYFVRGYLTYKSLKKNEAQERQKND
jgi:hypothetical protein